MKIYKIGVLLISQIVAMFLNFLVQIILAKFYGVEETGTYFSIISLMNIMSVIGLFGINKYYVFIRSSKINIANSLFKNLLLIYIVLNFLCSLILFGISYYRFSDYTLFVLSCVCLMVLTNLIAISTSIVQMKDKLIKISLLQIIVPFTKVSGLLIGIIILSNFLFGYSMYVLFFVFILILIAIARYYEKFRDILAIRSQNIKNTFKDLFPYAFLNIFFIFYTQGNIFYLGLLTSTEKAAYFGISYLFLNTIFIFPTAIYQKVLAHKMIFLLYNNVELFKIYYKNIQEMFIVISSVAMLIIYFVSEWLIITFFGVKYEESVRILQFLIVIIPFRLITISVGTILSNDKYILSRLKIELLVTLLNLFINFMFIPILGVNGAIISVILTEIMIAILFEKAVRKDFNIKINKQLYVFGLASLIAMFIEMNIIIKGSIIIIILVSSIKICIERMKIFWKK